MTTRSVVVTNALGLHARAAARFVHLANTFRSRVSVAMTPFGSPLPKRSGCFDERRASE